LKNSLFTLFTGSALLSTLLLSGCGGTVRTADTETQSTLQPHALTVRTSEVDKDENIDFADEWQNYVVMDASYNRTNHNAHKLSISIVCQQGVSSDVAHFQIFLDTDNNTQTGLSIGEGEYAITGADYMVEDGVLFKSTSTSDWSWTHVGEFDYTAHAEASNVYKIQFSSTKQEITSIVNEESVKNINISIESIDTDWSDTNNFVSTQKIALNVIGEKEVIVEPEPVIPEPITPNETVYEDAENGLSSDWITIKGDEAPTRTTPGYNNESAAFVKLPNHWTEDANGKWSNSAEYHLALNNTQYTMLSVDLVGDGTEVEHYVLGAKVTTTNGTRYLMWDSFYNHSGIPATRTPFGDGNAYIVFPSPVEMVRGYDYSDVNLSENFTVDLEAALKQFEPENEILSVDTFIATGGNLDNIKLLSK